MGAQFSGLGVGLPLARTYCLLMGGDLTLSATPAPEGDDEGKEGGTTAIVRIDPHGDTWWTPDMTRIGEPELMEHEA